MMHGCGLSCASYASTIALGLEHCGGGLGDAAAHTLKWVCPKCKSGFVKFGKKYNPYEPPDTSGGGLAAAGGGAGDGTPDTAKDAMEYLKSPSRTGPMLIKIAKKFDVSPATIESFREHELDKEGFAKEIYKVLEGAAADGK